MKNDDDADWEMAWRLQLEDLEEWSCTRGDRRDEEEDAEFAIIQQVEEIERAEREQAQAAGKSGLSSWIEEGGQIGDEQADKEFLNMAKACGWAKCCTCGMFVELGPRGNHVAYVLVSLFTHSCPTCLKSSA